MDAKGFTCLHYAAANGHLDMAALLIGQGADIDTPDKVGVFILKKIANFLGFHLLGFFLFFPTKFMFVNCLRDSTLTSFRSRPFSNFDKCIHSTQDYNILGRGLRLMYK